MLYTDCTLKRYDILKEIINLIYTVCTKQVFMFGSLDSYDSKLQSLSSFSQLTQCCLHITAHLRPANIAKSTFLVGSALK